MNVVKYWNPSTGVLAKSRLTRAHPWNDYRNGVKRRLPTLAESDRIFLRSGYVRVSSLSSAKRRIALGKTKSTVSTRALDRYLGARTKSA